VTGHLRSYPAAKAGIPAPAQVKHVFVKASARINNQAETVISRRANTSGACVGFVILNARRLSYRVQSDPPALRVQATPATCLTLSQTALRTLRRLASFH
jgi:hypothetical protein